MARFPDVSRADFKAGAKVWFNYAPGKRVKARVLHSMQWFETPFHWAVPVNVKGKDTVTFAHVDDLKLR